jgi:phosphopantetheinyl transferase
MNIWIYEVSTQTESHIAYFKETTLIPCEAQTSQQRILSRGLLRTLLGHTLQVSSQEIPITYNEYGKPQTPGIEFNLAHSHGIFMCAVNRTPIGIDCERLRPIQWEKLQKRFLHLEEQGNSLEHFLRIWTRKEAYLKAIGTGIVSALKDVNMTEPTIWNGQTLYVQNFFYSTNIVGAIALLQKPQLIEFKNFDSILGT